MSARYEIVDAEPGHIRALSLSMRLADKNEALAQSGLHPAVGLGVSFGASDRVWAGLVDGEVACVWGVGASDDIDKNVGVPWLMGSDLVVKHQRKFLRESRASLEVMHNLYPVLENYVDARNSVAIRWLRWLGFDIFATVPYGLYKLPFHPFRRVRG